MNAAVSPAAAPILAELEHEAEATLRLLAAVPADRLDWRPHERSFSLRQLASHVATIPGGLIGLMREPAFDFADSDGIPELASREEIIEAWNAGLAEARGTLTAWTEADLARPWKVLRDDVTLMEPRRAEALRGFVLNHLYHHRGQLSVYLRLLDVPVPSVYGPTADVDPFA